MQLVRDVELHVLDNAAVVGVEIPVDPLVALPRCLLAIIPGIVSANADDIFPGRGQNEVRYIKANCHRAVLVSTDPFAIQVKLTGLPHALETLFRLQHRWAI